MKKGFFFLLSFLSISLVTKAQDSVKHPFSIGIKGGAGMNINGYHLDNDNTFTYYSIDPHYTSGIDLGLFVSKKFRVRLEFNYLQMGYGMNWNYENSNFDKTITTLYTINAKAQCDYLFFSTNKLQLFASPAIVGENIFTHQFENKYADGSSDYKKYNVVDEQYTANNLGLEAAVMAKYNLTRKVGITLAPSYCVFVNKFVSSNDKLYQRIDLRLGVEYTFQKKDKKKKDKYNEEGF